MLADRIADAKKLYSIQSFLRLPDSTKKIVCPLHQHAHSSYPTPSFSIFIAHDGAQRWECHGNCGLRGDVIDLVGYLSVPGYEPHDPIKVELALALLSNHPIDFDRPRLGVAVSLSPQAWRTYLPPGQQAVKSAKRRGLTEETVRKFELGQYEHFLSIPAFEEGALRAIKFRNILPNFGAEKYMRFFSATGSRSALFNYDAVAYTERPLLVVKGEIPVMLLDQYGFLACAPTTGEASKMDQWVPILSFAEKKVVVGDNDVVPEIREKMQAKAKERAAALHAELRFPPEDYKDIDEFILFQPEVAIPMIEEWLR